MGALAHPADPWPNYTGKVLTYPDDALKIVIGGLTFEVEAEVECHGETDGGFYPVSAVVRDAEGNGRVIQLRFGGGACTTPLREAVIEAVDRDWKRIFAWLVEKAEEER